MFTLQSYLELKGVNQVAREMGVESATVSAWKNYKSAPRPHLAAKLIELTNNLLTWEGVYAPFVSHNNEAQTELDFK